MYHSNTSKNQISTLTASPQEKTVGFLKINVSVPFEDDFPFPFKMFFFLFGLFLGVETPRRQPQGLDYSAALELATLGRKAKECGRRPSQGGLDSDVGFGWCCV